MDFLKFVDISPACFCNILDSTADVEILSMIGKLLVETNVYFKGGIPKYGKNITLGQQSMDAKIDMLTALLNEYQVRRQMVERCRPVENLPPVERQIFAKTKKSLAADSIHFISNTDNVDIDAKSIGVHPSPGFKDRGLCIQIRHNRNKELFNLANKVDKIIVKALNEANLETPPQAGV